MARGNPKHVTIVGVGLLGGSIGLALKAKYPDIEIAGVGRRQTSLDQAAAIGAIDTAHFDATEPASKSDLIILATPVGAFARHLAAIAGSLKPGALVTDVGSTKAAVVRTASSILGAGEVFVGSHPMAGSEQKGPTYARADLFAGATCIVTPTAKTPASLAARTIKLWRDLGMKTVQMTPAAHDKALARVSHLPHVVAGLLMMLPESADLEVSATGLRDTTRLASGDPEMWRDILMTNRKAMLDAIDKLDENLMVLRDILDAEDAKGIERFLANAKKRRDTTIGQDHSNPAE